MILEKIFDCIHKIILIYYLLFLR